MNEQEKQIEKDKYRFSGYQLPKICLDETGPAYIQLPPHPYFSKTQPLWTTRQDTWKIEIPSKK